MKLTISGQAAAVPRNHTLGTLRGGRPFTISP